MQTIYAIVFNGQLVEGFQTISVKAHMAKLLKADADRMAKLFSGKPVVLKRTPDKQVAAKYGSALKRIGADVKVKIIKTESPATPVPTAPAAAAAAAATATATELSLRPNSGDIFDPQPEPDAPAVDVSNIEIAPDDGAFLTEPTEQPEPDLDLSAYEVAENDGSPLVEPSPEAERIPAPDFGLDEPGAVLETLTEEKELLNPDTSGITLAMTGTDLLDHDDSNEVPPAPDTSGIHLVPNFD